MKRIVGLIVIIGLLSLGAAGCWHRNYLSLGEQSYAKGNYAVAEIYLRKALYQAPHSDVVYYRLGLAYLKEGKLSDAFDALTHALKYNPKNQDAAVHLGTLYLLSGQADKAEQQARNALSAGRPTLEAQLLLGRALEAQEKYEQAKAEFTKIVHQYPTKAAGYEALALLNFQQKDSKAALSELDQAIQIEPKQIGPYLIKADYLRSNNQLQQATVLLRQAIKADGGAPAAKLALASTLLADQHPAEAIELLRQLSKKGPVAVRARRELVLAELQDRHYVQAAKDLAILEKQDQPGSQVVLYAKSLLALHDGKIDAGYKTLKKLTDAAPKFPAGFYYLGMTALRLGHTQEAEAALRTVTNLEPKSPQALNSHLVIAGLRLNRHDYSGAQSNAQQVLDVDGNNVAALLIRSDAQLAQKQPSEAAKGYEQVAKLRPKSPLPHQRLAMVALQEGKPKVAISELETGLKLNPALPDLLRYLAAVINLTEGRPAAIARIRKQLDAAPGSAGDHYLLARYLFLDSKYQPAITELNTALKQNPKLMPAYFALAGSYRKLGQTAQEESVLKTALAKDPQYVPALMMLGNLADQEHQPAKAITYYSRALKVNSDFGPAANNLAWDYLEQGRDLDKALELAQRARQLMPNNPNVADTIGQILLKRGLASSALPYLRESAKARPKSASAHYHLGFALFALNQSDEAQRELAAALKLDPSGKDAAEGRHDLALLDQQKAQSR